MFLPNTTSAVSGTTDGNIILWDGETSTKKIKLCDSSILTIGVVNSYIVIGSADGGVRFFDVRFRLEGYFEDFNAGPVTSISFSDVEDEHESSLQVPEFVIGTLFSLSVLM